MPPPRIGLSSCLPPPGCADCQRGPSGGFSRKVRGFLVLPRIPLAPVRDPCSGGRRSGLTNDKNLNHDTWIRLRREIGRFLGSKDGRKALSLLLLLTLALGFINLLNVINSYVGRDFMSAVEFKNRPAFVREAGLYLAVFAFSSVAAGIYRYMEERLDLLWRNWYTRELLDQYLAHRAYSHIGADGELQNPDQRIAEDVRTFTMTTISFVLLLLNAGITIVSFSGVLWSITPRLFVVAVAYATGGSCLTILLGRRLVGLSIQQLDREANLRSELLHVRENADAIALTQREEQLHRRILQRLDTLVANTRRMISVNLSLGLCANGYNYLIGLIPALIVAPMFMRGDVEFGVITQSAMAFATLMGAFSLAISQFQSISSYTAVVARLDRLMNSMEKAAAFDGPDFVLEESGDHLSYEHLTLKGAEDRALLSDLNLTIPGGMRVLVSSLSGHAKVELFRATAGLDRAAAGRITRPGAAGMLFIPEHPYLPKGSLRDVLAGSTEPGPRDEEIGEVLDRLGLEKVVKASGGLDVEHEWGALLGVSEQSQLLVARALILRPQLVFLDRMSLALEAAQMRRALALLSERKIGFILLGRPDDPVAGFDAVLEVAGDGSWNWRLLSPTVPRVAPA